MEEQMKKGLFLIFFGIVLYAAVMNLGLVLSFAGEVGKMFLPIFLGLIVAFVLSVPMRGFENLLSRLFARARVSVDGDRVRSLSLFLTFLGIILLLTVAFTLVIPELAKSAKSIYPLVQERLPEIVMFLENYSIDIDSFSKMAENFDWGSFFGGTKVMMDSVFSFASGTVSGLVNAVFALVISIYVLLSKQTLAGSFRRFLYANLSVKMASRLCDIGILVREVYAKFLSGQCVEAVILGILMFVSFWVCGLPYGGMIAFLTSIFAFIPYVGAFGACFIGALLIFIVEPDKVLFGILVFLVVQFVENQFIYPKVVGTSVGLSPLWTLVAALIGGKLLGVVGIIFFIPLVAVIYHLLRENTYKKLQDKNILL